MSITLLETENLNVEGLDTMPSPRELKARVPLTDAAAHTVAGARATLFRILEREDRRLFIVVGPCSIHDPVAGLDYAHRLHALALEVSETLVLIMRVYFE